MSLDVYLREDVARALEALSMASGTTAGVVYDEQPQDDGAVDALRNYRQGYTDALGAVAAAFGIVPGLVQLGAG